MVAAWLRRVRLWQWAALVALLVLAGFAVWFFFLRPGTIVTIVQTPPPRPALGKVISFGDYRRAVGQAQSDLSNAQTSSGDAQKKAIQQAVSDLDSVEGASVTPPASGGKPAQIDNTSILIELRHDAPNLTAASSALSALVGSLDTTSAQGIQGVLKGQPAIDALNKVLSDPIFDYTRNETPLEKLARWLAGLTGEADPGDTLWRWFLSIVAGIAGGILIYLLTGRIRNRWLRRGVSVLGGLAVAVIFFFGVDNLDSEKGGFTYKLLAAVGLGVAALVVGLVVAGLNRASSPSSVTPVSELAKVLGMSATEARRRAEEAAGEEDYRSAIRYRCLAVLLALDEAGMLTFDRTATNREYLFRASGPIHDNLQPLLDRFDQIWYGDSPTNAQEWADYNERAAAIEASITAETRTRARAA